MLPTQEPDFSEDLRDGDTGQQHRNTLTRWAATMQQTTGALTEDSASTAIGFQCDDHRVLQPACLLINPPRQFWHLLLFLIITPVRQQDKMAEAGCGLNHTIMQ
jgi:hypothetical protein